MMTELGRGTAVALSVLVMAGCAAKQARNVKPSGFLGSDAELLQKGEKGQALLRYEAPDVDWKAYQKIQLDPVQIWTDPNRKDKLSRADEKKLADYAYAQSQRALSKRWQLVQSPGPNTLRIQAAIVDAKASNVALDTVSSVLPAAFALSSLKSGATGKPTGVGEIQGEMRVIDSQSAKLLLVAVDKRVGKKEVGGKMNKWDDVESALRFWATQTASRLCALQGGTDCEQPTEAKPKDDGTAR